jgi:hypothetical protein
MWIQCLHVTTVVICLWGEPFWLSGAGIPSSPPHVPQSGIKVMAELKAICCKWNFAKSFAKCQPCAPAGAQEVKTLERLAAVKACWVQGEEAQNLLEQHHRSLLERKNPFSWCAGRGDCLHIAKSTQAD